MDYFLIMVRDFVVGIDASRNRSGGARAHIIGVLTEGDPLKYGIREVHLWAFRSLLESIPERPWLVKHNPEDLEKSLLRQGWWQATKLSREVVKSGCDILFTSDASSLCKFKPAVVLSQDMLAYEPGIMKRYGFSLARVRLITKLFVQNNAMKYSDGAIFLTQYAGRVIQQSCGPLHRTAHIPHGFAQDFSQVRIAQEWPSNHERPIRCLYVSNVAMYKHQWVVVKAITMLRKRGYNLTIRFVGGGSGKAQQLLEREIAISDPNGTFVTLTDFVPQEEVQNYLTSADLFIFASSCENMPVTLLEAMAAGLPIACSNRGPMPEVLVDGGVYFDPENASSIVAAVEQLINNPTLRAEVAQRAKQLSKQYSWARCADETWEFIVETLKSIRA